MLNELAGFLITILCRSSTRICLKACLHMDSEIKRTFREYTWSYFALHADQRIKTFNFFLIVAGLLAGGITTLLKDNGYARLVSPFGVLLTIFSFVFWKLDYRNKQLVKNAEEAIKYLDSQEGLADQGQNPHVLKMFDRDDYLTK